jgi:hypothetical protein
MVCLLKELSSTDFLARSSTQYQPNSYITHSSHLIFINFSFEEYRDGLIERKVGPL